MSLECGGIPGMPTAAKKTPRAKTCTAVATFKGGDAKTTVCISLASLTAAEGYRTLVIELEQRAHVAFALLPENIEGDQAHGAKNLLLNEKFEPIRVTENLDLLPGSGELDDARVRRIDNESLLDRIEQLDYDRIFIDCPANDQVLLRNGIVAADTLIVPIMVHPWSRNAAQDTLDWVKERVKKGRPAPKRIALVASRLDYRRVPDRQWPDHLRETFPDYPVFDLRVDVGLLKMTLERRPLVPQDLDPVVLDQLRSMLKWVNQP